MKYVYKYYEIRKKGDMHYTLFDSRENRTLGYATKPHVFLQMIFTLEGTGKVLNLEDDFEKVDSSEVSYE